MIANNIVSNSNQLQIISYELKNDQYPRGGIKHFHNWATINSHSNTPKWYGQVRVVPNPNSQYISTYFNKWTKTNAQSSEATPCGNYANTYSLGVKDIDNQFGYLLRSFRHQKVDYKLYYMYRHTPTIGPYIRDFHDLHVTSRHIRLLLACMWTHEYPQKIAKEKHWFL